MNRIVAAAIAVSAAALAVSSADAAQDAGADTTAALMAIAGRITHARVAIAPVRLVIGSYYRGHGYWDGRRYWRHRYRWHDRWRYR